MSQSCEGILMSLDESARLVRRLVERDLSPWGLSLPAWLVLTTLKREQQLSVGDLAVACSAQLPSMTRLVNRMEASGLVTRSRSEADQRIRTVSLTGEGIGLAGRLSMGLPVCQEIAQRLGARDQRAVEQMLGTLLLALRELESGAPTTEEMQRLRETEAAD